MAADRAGAALSDAELDELARRLCRLLHSAWLRRNGEGRAPFQSDARPPEPGEEERGVSTTRPQRILRDCA